MDIVKGKKKEKLIRQIWKVCRLILGRHQQKYLPLAPAPKSSSQRKTKSQVAPEGCFSVYVGSEKQKFVIKTEYANHPLFQMLLEDAELEYGYNREGPILIPCEVDLFCKVLAEMRSREIPSCCSIAYGSCRSLASSYRLGCNSRADGFGSYGLLNSHSFAIA